VRILYFLERFWPLIGGVEVISARVVPELRARGHEILVVTDREHDGLPERDEWAGVPIRRVSFLEPLRDRDLAGLAEARVQLAGIAAEHRPDLAHVTFTGAAVYFGRRSVLGAPVLASFHGAWPIMQADPGGALERMLAEALWVTGCAESAVRHLERIAPRVVAGKTSVVLNGFDPPDDREPDPPPPGPPVLFGAGRLVTFKGFDVAIAAFAKAAPQLGDARLVIAGDGPERAALEQQAREAGLADRVEFLGWLSPDDMHAAFARATAFVMTSRREGLPLVAIEAAHASRPTLASDIDGLPEIVAHGRTGLLCPMDDIDAFAQGMVALVRDPRRASEMGRRARERALREFSARRHADDWDALYRRLGAEVGASAA